MLFGPGGPLPAAIEIVKEPGGSRQNTQRRVRRTFSGRVDISLPDIPDIRVARGFPEIGEIDCTYRLFSVKTKGLNCVTDAG